MDATGTAFDAAKKIMDHDIGCVVVVENKLRVIGVITKGDILREAVIKKLEPDKVSVKDVMTHPALTIRPESSLDEAASIMSKNSITKLPVVKNDELVGIVTSTDLLGKRDVRSIFSKDNI